MLLAVPLTLLLFVAACGSDAGAGDTPASGSPSIGADPLGPLDQATGEPVKIGVVSDGKSAAVDNSVQFAVAEATARYFNEHKGGIGGRPIEIVSCETQSDPARGADCGNQMIEKDVVAVAVGESSVTESVWKPLSDAGIPTMIFGAGNPAILADDTSYILGDPSFTTLQLPISLAKDKGVDKVASIVIDVPNALEVAQRVAPGRYKDNGLEYQLVTVPPGTADMTPQMKTVLDGGAGLVFVVGNDAFCISAFDGLKAVGYDGTISAISQCLSDATREAVSAEVLDGMVIGASVPVGGDEPSTTLYNTVLDTYGDDIDQAAPAGRGMFVVLGGLVASLDNITGDITPATVNATIKAMPEIDLPGAAGLKFRCNGKAYPKSPAVCVRGGLTATLDNKGNPTAFDVTGSSPIPD
ncbi:ABC transporter substrate-binding protein [Frankia nepalensis]|nr:ABC transporter substrate-binding protein [Frankia nepalensis]